MNQGRVAREKGFHESRFGSDDSNRQAQLKFYSLTIEARDKYRFLIEEKLSNSEVLEYGCGEKIEVIEGSFECKNFVAIDISEVAVEKCRKKYKGVDKVQFEVMNAEQLLFQDAKFDLIYGSGIIHHLDIDLSMKEISRCLKNGGSAVFFEPLGHNPFINFYRKLTPKARSQDEHPLLVSDLEKIRANFKNVEEFYFVLFTLLLFPLRNLKLFSHIYKFFSKIENAFLTEMPNLKKYCWIVVFKINK
jgi:ubiquinone/menaquinone biosynthesis C-methylase UbiE